jgi:hypothetical protein
MRGGNIPSLLKNLTRINIFTTAKRICETELPERFHILTREI